MGKSRVRGLVVRELGFKIRYLTIIVLIKSVDYRLSDRY